MSRELFEEWALSVGWSVGRHFKNDDVYAHSYCQCGWQAWQASEKSAKERQEHPTIVVDWPACNPGCDYESPMGWFNDCRNDRCTCEPAKASIARQRGLGSKN